MACGCTVRRPPPRAAQTEEPHREYRPAQEHREHEAGLGHAQRPPAPSQAGPAYHDDRAQDSRFSPRRTQGDILTLSRRARQGHAPGTQGQRAAGGAVGARTGTHLTSPPPPSVAATPRPAHCSGKGWGAGDRAARRPRLLGLHGGSRPCAPGQWCLRRFGPVAPPIVRSLGRASSRSRRDRARPASLRPGLTPALPR